MDTRPDSKCRVTANTNTQLDTATWADIHKWGALKLTASRWAINTETTYHLGDRSNWFGIRATCAPENTTVVERHVVPGFPEERLLSRVLRHDRNALALVTLPASGLRLPTPAARPAAGSPQRLRESKARNQSPHWFQLARMRLASLEWILCNAVLGGALPRIGDFAATGPKIGARRATTGDTLTV